MIIFKISTYEMKKKKKKKKKKMKRINMKNPAANKVLFYNKLEQFISINENHKIKSFRQHQEGTAS